MGFNLKKNKSEEVSAEAPVEEMNSVSDSETVAVKDAKKKSKDKKEKKQKQKVDKKESKTLKEQQLKKIFNKQTFLLVTLGCVLVVVVVYVFVYLDYTAKTEELEASNQKLKERVRILEEYEANKAQYKIDIEDYTNAINETLEQYPADTREENAIMLAVDMQKENSIAYTAIDIKELESVHTVEAGIAQNSKIEGFENAISFGKREATYTNTTDYANLKGCVEQIFASDNRIAVDSIIYTKNQETGELEGKIDLTFYCAQGTGKEYIVPDMTAYISGTSDIFQSGSVAKKVEDNEESDSNEDSNEDGGEEASEE